METRVSDFLTPSSVLFSTPESRVGPGPRVEPQDAGLTAVKVGMRARRATAFLERPDRGRHFVLSRWRPAAPWRELGGAPCGSTRGPGPTRDSGVERAHLGLRTASPGLGCEALHVLVGC